MAAGSQLTVAHSGQLLLGSHLLGKQCRLYALDQALEPTDQLGLRYPQFVRAGSVTFTEGQNQAVQLAAQLLGKGRSQLVDRGLKDLPEAPTAGLIED